MIGGQAQPTIPGEIPMAEVFLASTLYYGR
jgi:hypothetical protein